MIDNSAFALFVFAFIPQFVNTNAGPVGPQLLLLGATFVAMGIVSDTLYALVAGSAAHRLRRNARFLRGQRYFAGTMYMALGLTTALVGAEAE